MLMAEIVYNTIWRPLASRCQYCNPLAGFAVISYSSVFDFPIMLVERWNLFARGLRALVFRSNPLTQINPLIKQVWISSIDKPLSIVAAEVAKYAVHLSRCHINSLGTFIGFWLDSSSATSLTWKYVPFCGKLPLIAIWQRIKIVLRIVLEFCSWDEFEHARDEFEHAFLGFFLILWFWYGFHSDLCVWIWVFGWV